MSNPAASLILQNTTVVDVREATLRSGVDVVIEGGQITGVESTGAALPEGAQVVDGSGSFVVPGYVDSHAHPIGQEVDTLGLELMGAFGITGFRQMSGVTSALPHRQQLADSLPADGPALLALPGDVLLPPNSATLEAAVATVTAQKEAGADFIKVVSVSPQVFLGVLDAAAKLNIPVAGHLPNGIDVREVSRRGMRCIEHLGPGVGITAATADDEASILADAAVGARTMPTPPPNTPDAQRAMAAMLEQVVINPVNMNKPLDVELLERADETFDEQKARAVAAEFTKNETWQCPTLIRVRTQQLADDPVHTDDPDLRYIDAATLAKWKIANERFAQQSDDAHGTYRRNYALQLRLTKIFEDEGVPLLVGTDSGGAAGWLIPGHAIHQEFDEMATAGLAPLTILRAATSNAADFLGLSDRLGAVDEGKDADLVILASNPLESVSALHDIVATVRAGKYRDAAELEAVKERIAAARVAS
ncbi:amidohydrolase family protein [Subtercola lobariae]|uniref:Amidohydrolase-related domain-containing protein n=1 Tax=Subtercola lobariae TaxID=1588641 RepID=A0A917B9F2_9MICO|nr:amidohydrolase family protein [Subtercola lobariae]GGF30568.1 hypothetical protein GCM10011399_24760 [Subtercola lobariae]